MAWWCVSVLWTIDPFIIDAETETELDSPDVVCDGGCGGGLAGISTSSHHKLLVTHIWTA